MEFKNLKIIGVFGNTQYGTNYFDDLGAPKEWGLNKGYVTNYGRLYFLFGKYLTEEEVKIKIKNYHRKLKLENLCKK